MVKKRKKQIYLLCSCTECGKEYWIHLTEWKHGLRNRCVECTSIMSNLEKKVEQWLIENNIKYIFQYRTEKCKNKRKLPFDFYLPKNSIFIEIDGPQHQDSNLIIRRHKFTDEEVKEIQFRDAIKTKFCLDNHYKLIRISHDKFQDDNYIKILEENIINQ